MVNQQGARFASVELLRILSMFLIVWFHSRVGGASLHNIVYAGLVCFIMITAFFNLTHETFDAVRLRKVFIRIILPWVIWSIIYMILLSATGRMNFSINSSIITYGLRGTSIHLWYLPFSLMMTIAFFAVFPMKDRLIFFVISSALLVLWTLTATFWRPWSLSHAAPIPQYAHAIFPCLSGALIYQGILVGRRIALAIVFMAAIALVGMAGVGITYVVGAGLFVGALFFKNKIRAPRQVFAIAECMFGVYLIHPLIFPISRAFLGEFIWLIPFFTFVLATASILFVRAWAPAPLRMAFGLAA